MPLIENVGTKHFRAASTEYASKGFTYLVSREEDANGNFIAYVVTDRKGNILTTETDETKADVAIQAAIDALPDVAIDWHRAGSGKILLSPGLFKITSMIDVNKNFCVIEGMGSGEQSHGASITLLDTFGNPLPNSPDTTHFPNGVMFHVHQPDNYGYIAFRHFQVRCGGDENSRAGGFNVDNSRMVYFEDLMINAAYHGMDIAGGNGAHLRDINFPYVGEAGVRLSQPDNWAENIWIGPDLNLTPREGFRLQGASHTIASNITVDPGFGSWAILLTSSAECLLYGLTTHGAGVEGIFLTNGSNRNVLSDCIAVNNGQDTSASDIERSGIRIYDSSDNVVVGNTCMDRQDTATQVYGVGEDGSSDNNRIENNNCRGTIKGATKAGANTVLARNHGYTTENSDTATFSGDGSTTEFTISSHGLAENPSDQTRIYCEVAPVSADAKGGSPCECYPADADGDGNYEALTVKFSSAPASGTDNVVVRFKAELY